MHDVGSYYKPIYSSVASVCMTPARHPKEEIRKSASWLLTMQLSSFYLAQLLHMPL